MGDGDLAFSQTGEAESQQAQLRLAFLAEAGKIFANSLEIEDALQSLARLAVTFLSDICLIDLLEDDGSIRRVAAVHADPDKQELTRALQMRYGPDPKGPHPAVRVMRTGRSEFSPEMPEDFLRRTTRDEEHLRIVLELGFQSYMCVPLLARNRVLGTFTLVSTNPERRFVPEDVRLAEELAGRAALALDNARLYEAERQARETAELSLERLTFLAQASEVLAASLDYGDTLGAIARLAVPRLADWCLVDMLEDDGSIHQSAVAHVDPAKELLSRELRTRYPPVRGTHHALWQVLMTGQPVLAQVITEEELRGRARNEEHLQMLLDLGIRSHMVVPLTARGRILGAISFVFGQSGRRYTEDDLTLALELARHAALAVDNGRLYQQQLHIARTLQETLLPPSLPAMPGMEVAARYRAAREGSEVGGDFYDVFETVEGGWVLVIGDVCGKGPEAAAVTGLARYTLRATALQQRRPSKALAVLNETILRELADGRFCTVCYALVRPGDQGVRLTTSSAGHPLPIVVRADGTVESIGRPGVILGVFDDIELSDHSVELCPGDSLVLYTDGVTERFSAGEVFGSSRLAEILAASARFSAESIADSIHRAVVEFGSEAPRDDLALVVLRVRDAPAGV